MVSSISVERGEPSSKYFWSYNFSWYIDIECFLINKWLIIKVPGVGVALFTKYLVWPVCIKKFDPSYFPRKQMIDPTPKSWRNFFNIIKDENYKIVWSILSWSWFYAVLSQFRSKIVWTSTFSEQEKVWPPQKEHTFELIGIILSWIFSHKANNCLIN